MLHVQSPGVISKRIFFLINSFNFQFRENCDISSSKRLKDCVRFYYESKKNIDFKALLREHQQRRRGLKLCWTETIYAMNSFRCSTFCDDDDDDDDQDLSLFELPNEQNLHHLNIDLFKGLESVKIMQAEIVHIEDKVH